LDGAIVRNIELQCYILHRYCFSRIILSYFVRAFESAAHCGYC